MVSLMFLSMHWLSRFSSGSFRPAWLSNKNCWAAPSHRVLYISNSSLVNMSQNGHGHFIYIALRKLRLPWLTSLSIDSRVFAPYPIRLNVSNQEYLRCLFYRLPVYSEDHSTNQPGRRKIRQITIRIFDWLSYGRTTPYKWRKLILKALTIRSKKSISSVYHCCDTAIRTLGDRSI